VAVVRLPREGLSGSWEMRKEVSYVPWVWKW